MAEYRKNSENSAKSLSANYVDLIDRFLSFVNSWHLRISSVVSLGVKRKVSLNTLTTTLCGQMSSSSMSCRCMTLFHWYTCVYIKMHVKPVVCRDMYYIILLEFRIVIFIWYILYEYLAINNVTL